jgi:hypothetical protein
MRIPEKSGPVGMTPAIKSQKLYKRIRDVGASVVGDASGGAFHIFHQPVEIIARVRDADDADGSLIPKRTRLKFGDRDVERRAETVFKTARDLTLVLERVRGFNAEFERKESDHEQCKS